MQENFQIIRSVQERILQILEIEKVTPYKFCKDLGFSQGYLDKRGAIGTDKYLKIIKYLSAYNPMWILNEEGEILKQPEGSAKVSPDPKDQYIIDLQKKHIAKLEEELAELKKAQKHTTGYGMVAESKSKLKK